MDSTQDTLEHIGKVQARMAELIYALQGRSKAHDSSKLEAPEKRGYDVLKELIEGKPVAIFINTAEALGW